MADVPQPSTDPTPVAPGPGTGDDFPFPVAEVETGDDAGLSVRDRLLLKLLGARRLALGSTPRDRLWGWLGPALVAVLAGGLRLWDLGRPGSLVFDETYYVKQAYTLLRVGFEAKWPEDPNPAFEAGNVDTFLSLPDYVVHPPLGKWMIAGGMQLFGGAENPWSWRISTALVGILAVFLLARIARRLFASTAMGVLAGGLLAIDGMAIVHSRTGLLDNFLMFWVLVAFGFLLLDREQARRRLADRVAALVDSGREIGRYGPRLGWRWWRFAAAVSLGLACGVKWSGLYFLAVFALLSVLWDASARRAVGIKRWWEDTLLVDAVPAALIMLPTAALTYLATWFSWFRSPSSYMRDWAAEHPGEGVQWLPDALRSLWAYHQKMWDFHTGLSAEHSYASKPIGWIVQWRPTSFYYRDGSDGVTGCGYDECARVITSLGNPVLWWSAALAIVATVVLLVWRKDWRATAVLSGLVAGWLPWFAYPDRTIFTFYAIVFTPWVVLALVYVVTVLLEATDKDRTARGWVIWGATALLTVIVVMSIFFYPIWTAMNVPEWFWRLHMWLPSWI